MSGSSRSLIKALNEVFESWDDSAGAHWVASPEATECFTVISQFLERHNTFSIIRQSTSINDELFRIYNSYIEPSSNLQKEYMFLNILRQLSPVLRRDDVMLWVKTYLKPAIDSAGFDFNFVQKSREFIAKVAIDIMPTDDIDLRKEREEIAYLVMDIVIQVYIGVDDKSYDYINLKISEEDKDSQHFQERLRFIKHNCTTILQDYGLKQAMKYFTLLNNHFEKPSERFGALTLLSSLVSTQTSQVFQITNTILFPNLLKCISYDFSESLVYVSLSVLVMLIPQIGNRISNYLSDLLIIYIRITNWEEFDRYIPNRYELLVKFLHDKGENWSISNFDFFNELMTFVPLNSKLDFDVSHLATLIYGLFPFNFSKFCQSPLTYLNKYPPRLIELKFLQLLDTNMMIQDPDDPTKHMLEKRVIDKTKKVYQRFIIHPNFIDFDRSNLLSEEIKNPIQWILDLYNGESIGPSEISVSCLSLNPDIMISISDSLVVSEDHKLRDNQISGGSPLGSNIMFNNRNNFSTAPNSQHVSRASSVGSPVYFNIKDGPSTKLMVQKSLQNYNRKMSVVPTNLVIDNQKTLAPTTPLHSEIKFKDVKFNGGSDKNNSNSSSVNNMSTSLNGTSVNENGIEEKLDHGYEDGLSQVSSSEMVPELGKSEPLPELFITHEKLYGSNNKASALSLSNLNLGPAFMDDPGKKSSSNLLNEKLKSELRIQRPISSPTTSLETTAVHKGSVVSSSGFTMISTQTLQNNGSTHNGTALDFYQRELLLMKNELEFSSYMKHLNKFQYIRLKLKMNKLQREANLHFQSIEHKNNISLIKSLKEECDTLKDSLKSINSEMEDLKSGHKSKIFDLSEKIIELQEENSELRLRLDDLSGENRSINSGFNTIVNEVVPEKDFEIENLKMRLQELELNNVEFKKQIEHFEGENSAKRDIVDKNHDLSIQEKKIYSLKEELLLVSDKNQKLAAELAKAQDMYESIVRTYENKLSSSKFDLNENVNSFTAHFEKKIQELSTTILRYEALLEEKNSKIMQLSSSKPISIPGAASSGVNTIYNRSSKSTTRIPSTPGDINDMHGEKGRSNSSLESGTPPPSRVPIGVQQHPSQQSQFTYPHLNQVGAHAPPQPPAAIPRFSANLVPTVGTSSQQPIIRGRGGYQKRSKKHM
ncbi:hypothetical protein G9P44_002409 [Scheffersomyces stipitis]|nr:hypothetical protein G9P44_002409 [Scheffersomyces stipitis]